MTRRRILSVLVGLYALCLLAAGLGAAFFGDSGGYRPNPEPRAPAEAAPAEVAPAERAPPARGAAPD